MRPPSSTPLLLAALLLFAFSIARAQLPHLADCEARFAAAPEEEKAAECFYEASRDPRQRAEAIRRIEILLRSHPRHPWLTFYLGSLLWEEPARSAALYRSAAGLLAERRDVLGEVRARSNLYRQLARQDLHQEAAAEVARARRIAEASSNRLALARARILEASLLYDRKEDLTRAYRLLLEADGLLSPEDPYPLRRDCLIQRANIALQLGRLSEARRGYQNLVELTVGSRDPYAEALARYNVLRTLRDELALLPRDHGREEALALARQALAVAEASGHREMEAKSHAVLGVLTPSQDARGHFERCFEAAKELDDKSWCRSMQARRLTAEDPEGALRAVDEAAVLARKANDPWAIAYSWRERMRVSWQLGPPSQAVNDSLAALAAIEDLRDLQTSVEGRAELFSTWVGHYHWLAGRFLQEYLPGRSRDHLEHAFQVQERMRTRALIDALETARAVPSAAKSTQALQASRAAKLAEISQVQRRLLDPRLATSAREAARSELRRLEIDEEDLRDQILHSDPSFAALRRPDFAKLADVQRTLAEDEALLSFQIAPWKDMVGDFMGGAWLIVITRGGSRAYPLRHRLANRTDLRPAVEAFIGLLENGEDGGAGALALYEALLSEGLSGLPNRVNRLVIIPDDALYRLPFAALRSAPEAAPLTSRFEITLAPSATLWLRWQKEPATVAETPALVLADPVSPATVQLAASERQAAFTTAPPQLGTLPWARREGKSVIDHLGGDSELLVGKEASEAYLKKGGAARFGLVHFASHALTDDVNPDRSGVVLSPGDAKEDGLLQVREITGLDLRGRTIVLSSCSSASGEILRGEGVMGLARAFFQAGAHTVVASLWPLRDDHGADLFDRFYRHIAEGKSVAAALQAAQLDRLEEGAPPVAWAGVVVLGDGDHIPVPGGRRQSPLVAWIPAVLTLAILTALAVWARRSHRHL